MTKPLRAALYARFSTDLQRDASIEDQLRSCRAFATKQGIEVVEVYSDRAISGASLMRSGMQKMLRDAQVGRFDIVVSEAMDRLSRSQSDIAAIFERFQFRGIMIETLSEGLLSELHIGMKGTMNAIFLKDLGIKTRRGLMGRALAGKCAGGKAYGYKNLIKYTEAGDPIKGDRAIIPSETATINRIFTDYAKERNRLMAVADNGRDALTVELATVTRDHSKLVDAIIAGIPAGQVKERMNTLTQRKTALETQLATTPNADKIRIHPKMALTYRDKVSVLIDQLGKPDHMAEAKEALRGLIDRIVLSPNAVTGNLDIKIEGALACLLSLGLGSRYKNGLSIDTQAFDVTNELVLVAGVGFEPTTFRL